MKRTTCIIWLCCAVVSQVNSRLVAVDTTPSQKPAPGAPTSLPPPPRPEVFTTTNIPLPPNVAEAPLVNYLGDGEHLVLQVRFAGSAKSDIAVMKDDGSGFKCLTSDLKEKIGGEMPVPLPDGKRVYTPTGILECSPSIVDCQAARILPLVYPTIPGATTVARVATNMSPDGVHVAYTLITTRGPFVLVSELTRVSDEKGARYELANTRVVGGIRTFVGDPANLKVAAFGNGEVKSFICQGRCLTTISAFETNNSDIAELDLATGEVSRFTRHFSWDEGVYPSPDGEWVIVQTHRHTNRMDAFGLIPRPFIAGRDLGYGVGYYRNEVVNPPKVARRFYGLVMLDKYGDRARLPEDGYTGQMLTVAKDNLIEYNHAGNFTWHPTSTRGVFWEQKDHLKVKAGEANGRLRMIRFTSRHPTRPLVPFTPDMIWAPKLEDMPASLDWLPNKGRIKGDVSGYAEFVIEKQNSGPKEAAVFKITYVNYSDDGVYILDGVESSSNDGATVPVIGWNADISVTGQRKGFLKAENVIFHPWKIGSGIIRTQLGDHKAELDLARGAPTGVPGELR